MTYVENTWIEKNSIEKVLHRAKIKRTLMTTIRKRQLHFVGHITDNMDELQELLNELN